MGLEISSENPEIVLMRHSMQPQIRLKKAVQGITDVHSFFRRIGGCEVTIGDTTGNEIRMNKNDCSLNVLLHNLLHLFRIGDLLVWLRCVAGWLASPCLP